MSKKDFFRTVKKEKENLILAIYEWEIIYRTPKTEFNYLIKKTT